MATQPKMQRKIPTRRCVGCGEHFPKNELIRVVRSPQGEMSLDFVGKAPGRGAYLCKNVACLQKARKTRRLEAAFSSPIEENVYAALEEKLTREES
jgi:predicted RNA-binding protein YlxR (DUF448 family)